MINHAMCYYTAAIICSTDIGLIQFERSEHQYKNKEGERVSNSINMIDKDVVILIEDHI